MKNRGEKGVIETESRTKEIVKFRAEINEIGRRGKKINTRRYFFENINEIDKLLTKLTKKNQEKTNY